MGYKSISDYGIIGNMVSAALVGTDAAIDWCCLPRFDSPSVFAALLDDEMGGRFQIRPVGDFRSNQTYVQDTNVLKTAFETDTGTATITDFMPCYDDSRGRLVQLNEIHRLVECSEGRVEMEALLEPRLDYARGHTELAFSRDGVSAKKNDDRLIVSSYVSFERRSKGAVARFTLAAGEKTVLVLRYGSNQPRPAAKYRSLHKLEQTLSYWRRQAEACAFPGPWREAIVRSYLALHLLVYSPTGAILAASTTSLPESIGGERNWDYRFTWLRDASLTLNAFSRLGHTEEGMRFMNKWLMTVCGKCGARAQVLYDIDFQHPLDEQRLDHLKGYRESRPVRIGNDAYKQLQLDIFGEVLEAAYNYSNAGGRVTVSSWGALETFVDAAAENWRRPDSGIWEVRGGPYHFVYSKVMCWVAVDIGIKMAEKLGYTAKIQQWRRAAEEIRSDILARGWNAELEAFTQHYDTGAMDASNLLIPLIGFLPVSDRKMRSTIERTTEELGWDGLLRRYRTEETDDGLSGSEGAFLICSFWLTRNLIMLGRLEEARAVYERLLGYGNHLGLFSEMTDPITGEALGNFPQAFTHLATIVTGIELAEVMQEESGQEGIRWDPER